MSTQCDKCKTAPAVVQRFLNGSRWFGCVACWQGILAALDVAR